MVRLVFRPYTQVRRSICTSESLRTSTRVSSGFILLRNSSPSFGSQRVRSVSAPLQAVGTGLCCARAPQRPGSHISCTRQTFTFIAPLGFQRPMTRAHAKLLGPCFKTGRTDDRLLHRGRTRESSSRTELTADTCRMRPPSTASSAPTRARNQCPSEHSAQTTLPRPGYQTACAVGLKAELMPLSRAPRRTPPANAPPARQQPSHLPNLECGKPGPDARRLNAGQIRQLCPFPPHRFHVLFNSLFKVLCNFPSRYLFAIGLVVIFSLR
jgi:hypothetical protein